LQVYMRGESVMLLPPRLRAHQSTEGPWPVPLMISGARYSSVPTKELARPSGSAISTSCSASAAALFSALLPCCFCRHSARCQSQLQVGYHASSWRQARCSLDAGRWARSTRGRAQAGSWARGAVGTLTERRTLLLPECREVWLALFCSRGVVPFVQKDRSKSVSSACPLALSRMFSGFRSLCKWEPKGSLITVAWCSAI
jgi:hypothetical protein